MFGSPGTLECPYLFCPFTLVVSEEDREISLKETNFIHIPAVLPPEVAAAGGVVAAGVAPRVAAHAERDAQPPLHVLVERAPAAQSGRIY